MKKEELYYQVVKPEHDDPFERGYQHARITIWIRDDTSYNPKDGSFYLSDHDKIVSLEYLRDNTRTMDGQDPGPNDKTVISRWYAEGVESLGSSMGVHSGLFVKPLKVFQKMERIHAKIRDKGLSLQDHSDDLLSRIALLKMAGAQEVYYSPGSHSFMPVGCTA